jgi:large subunit ribosomal protein L33
MSERARVALACSECGARNYHTTRARDAKAPRLEIKKHCPTCKKHTLHKESK